jgi:hypothetical protein
MSPKSEIKSWDGKIKLADTVSGNKMTRIPTSTSREGRGSRSYGKCQSISRIPPTPV